MYLCPILNVLKFRDVKTIHGSHCTNLLPIIYGTNNVQLIRYLKNGLANITLETYFKHYILVQIYLHS